MTDQAIAQDPFRFDSEQLREIADEQIIGKGLDHFRDNRVTDLSIGENFLSAQIEDRDTLEMVSTEISYDDGGDLCVACDCGDEKHAVCLHAVALLYAYDAEIGGKDILHSALDSAIDERAKRGRGEVRVKPVRVESGYGTWGARSLNAGNPFPRTYSVHIRSLQRRANYCNCPDFAANQLGTCKHIEAVMHKLSKRRDYKRLLDQQPPFSYVYLAWDAEQSPCIVLYRAKRMARGLRPVVDAYFDTGGLFKGSFPDDFFRFQEQVEGRTDIDVGEDASSYARQHGAAAARQSRAEQIEKTISAAGGHLPDVKARLYPYQVTGVSFLVANGRALLADDMGLGKTLQAIAAATWLLNNADARKVLIICPASLKYQWAREIERFTRVPAQIIQGAPSARAVQYHQGEGFYIANYELVLRDLSVINEQLSPDLVILDEAQRIKNWRTKIAAAVKLIPSRYAFVLTGTPLENRLEDLYSLMQVVDPRVLGPLWRYLIDFHITDERGKVQGYRNLSELRRRLAPVMLRRDRRLVSDQLPERIQQRLDLPLTTTQQELHDDAMTAAGALASISKRRPLTPGEQNRLMAALQQARMACNAAGLVDKVTKGSPKLDELANLLDDLCLQGGRKAVVFSQWEMMTRMAETRLRAMGLGCVRLHGGVPSSKRGGLIDRFREDDGIQVFLSTDAGGVGLNLQSASVLINLDVPWNPAVLEQRIARIHRLGQRDQVHVILLISTEGYEGRVMELVQGKQHLFDNVIDPDASADVVGVSPKLLEKLIDDLAVPPDATAEEAAVAAVAGKAAQTSPAAADEGGDPVARAISHAVEALQKAYGPRIERILGVNAGLLVLMRPVDEGADRFSEELTERINNAYAVNLPVALLEPRALEALRCLGMVPPAAESRVHFEGRDARATRTVPPLLQFARERLDASELLVEQDCTGPALELLGSALLSAAAARAGLERAPSVEESGVWLYGEAIPKGWVDGQQGAMIMKCLGLAQARAVPNLLLRGLLEEAREFCTIDVAAH